MIVIEMIMIQMNVMPIAIYALKFLTMTSIKLQNETMPSGSALPLSRSLADFRGCSAYLAK